MSKSRYVENVGQTQDIIRIFHKTSGADDVPIKQQHLPFLSFVVALDHLNLAALSPPSRQLQSITECSSDESSDDEEFFQEIEDNMKLLLEYNLWLLDLDN